MPTITQSRRTSAFVRTSLHARSCVAPALNLAWPERLLERYNDIVIDCVDIEETEQHFLLDTLYGVDGS